MKIIGKMEGGAVLVEMEAAEIESLQAIASWVYSAKSSSPAQEPERRAADAFAGLPAREVKPVRAEKPVKARAPVAVTLTGKRLCAYCHKPLALDAYKLAKCHPGDCLKAYNRDRARAAWRAKHAVKNPRGPRAEKPPAPAANPSDPMLSDEERKAARLALIKSRAEALGDK